MKRNFLLLGLAVLTLASFSTIDSDKKYIKKNGLPMPEDASFFKHHFIDVAPQMYLKDYLARFGLDSDSNKIPDDVKLDLVIYMDIDSDSTDYKSRKEVIPLDVVKGQIVIPNKYKCSFGRAVEEWEHNWIWGN